MIRARLDEAIQRAQARFPVYLVFTHLDSIEGFEEFFKPFGSEERSQVWGATIKIEQAQNAHALFRCRIRSPVGCLDAPQARADWAAPAPSAEQLRVFNFPLLFAELRTKLGLFTSALFKPNPFSENPLLRGFYFTSSAAGERPKVAAQSVVAKSGATTASLVKPESVAEEKADEVKVARRGLLYRTTV